MMKIEETITLHKAGEAMVIIVGAAPVGVKAFLAGRKREMYYAKSRLEAIGRLCRSNPQELYLRLPLLERLNDEELGRVVSENPHIRGCIILDGDAN